MALTRILGSFKDAILTNVVSSSAQIASDISGSFVAKADKSAISGSIVGGVSGSAASTGSFGSIYTDKNVNASAFVGDGSSLTGIDIPTAADISGSIVGGVSGSATSTGSFGRVEAAGDVELKAGNLIIGTGGKGIDFSAQTATSEANASADSEVLDHYEEGTWTPFVLTTLPTPQNATMNTNDTKGTYVRIGRKVCLHAYVAMSSKASMDGAIHIGGRPFVSDGNPNYGGGAVAYAVGYSVSSGQAISVCGVVSGTNIYMHVWSGTTAIASLTDGDIEDGFMTIWELNYNVDNEGAY